MSFFGGGGGTKVKPQYTGIQLQTASSVLALTLAWGCNRFAPNLIWYADFKAHKQTQKTGGKGGGGKVESYTYSASCILALCDGGDAGISGVAKVYKDNDKSTTLASNGMSLFKGTIPQATWGYLTSRHPSQARTYSGVAHIAIANYDLGASAALPNHSFEVQALQFSTSKDGSNDADPALIVDDFLMSPYFGAGMSPTNMSLDTLMSGPNATTTGDAALQTYCAAMGFGLSPVLSDPKPASDTLDRWMKILNTAIVWTGYTLKFIPYDLNEITAYGYHYKPVTEAIYTLTDADFLSDNEDPIAVTRTDPADANNSLKLTFSDSTNDYNDKPVEYKDQGLIDQFQLRQANTFEAPEITRADMATKVVDIMGIREAYFRNSYKFVLGPSYCLIEPMDLLILVDPKLGTITVQVTDVTEDDDGNFAIVGDEISAAITSSTGFTPPATSSGQNNTGISPGSVNPPLIFDVPADLSNGIAQVWIGVSGGNGTVYNQYWGGCLVWVSTDEVSYQNIGNIDSPARMGKTTDPLPAYAGTNPDAGNTVGVNLAMSDGELVSVSAGDAEAGRTLSRIGGEFVSFEDATLTSTNNYDLDNLYRGLYRSGASSHASGSDFIRLDESVFKYELPPEYVGVPLFFKFQSYNIWNQAMQDLADCDVYEYTPSGAGFDIDPPSSTGLAFTSRQQSDGTNIIEGTVTVGPSDGPYLDHYDVQIAAAPYTTWVDLPAISAAGTKTTMQPALASTNYKARARAVSSAVGGVPSAWVESPVVGSGSLATAAPSAPTSLVASGGLLSNTLTWDAGSGGGTPSGFKIYAIHASTGSFGSATLIGTVQGVTRYVHSGLSANDTWRYFVTAYNFVGESSPAGPSNATTDAGGGGGGSLDIEQEDVTIVSAATAVNFMGPGVSVTNGGSGTADVYIQGGGSPERPVVRGWTNVTAYAGTVDIPLPSGSLEGDFAIVFAGGGWNPLETSGWTTFSHLSGTGTSGRGMYKNLSSSDIGNGFVTVTFNNSYDLAASIIVFEGPTNGIGDFDDGRSSGSTGTRIVTVTDAEPTDTVAVFGYSRGDGNVTFSPITNNHAAARRSDASCNVGYYDTAGGTSALTIIYGADGGGNYGCAVVVKGASGFVEEAPLDGQQYVRENGSWVVASGGGGGSLTVEEEGAAVATGVNTLNFTGSGVSVTDDGSGQVSIDITGGGGGGGGATAAIAVGEWREITFSGSGSNKWGGHNFFQSNEQINLLPGDYIEVEAVIHRPSGEEAALAFSLDGERCYQNIRQSDNNWVYYRYQTSAGGSTVLSGGVYNDSGDFNEYLNLAAVVADPATGGKQRSRAMTFQQDLKWGTDDTVNVPLVGAMSVWVAAVNRSDIIRVRYRTNKTGTDRNGAPIARFWAVKQDGQRSNAYCCTELTMHETVGGPNICVGGTPIASSAAFGAAANAFDGNTGTFWGTNDDNGEWIGYEFPTEVTVQQFTYQARSGGEAAQTGTHYGLIYSNDGLAWHPYYEGAFPAFSSLQIQTFTTDGLGLPGGNLPSPPNVSNMLDQVYGSGATILTRRTRKDMAIVSSTSPPNTLSVLYENLPSGDFWVWWRVRMAVASTNYSIPYLGVYNDSTGQSLGLQMYYEDRSPQVRVDNIFTGAYTSDTKIIASPMDFMFRIERAGTTYRSYISMDGINWALMRTDNNPFTATRWGFGFRNGTNKASLGLVEINKSW